MSDQFADFDRGYTKMRDEAKTVKLHELHMYEGHNNVHIVAAIIGVGPLKDHTTTKNKVPIKSKNFSLLICDDTAVANCKIWFPQHHAEFTKLKGRGFIFRGFKVKAMDDQGKALRTSIGTFGLDANEGQFAFELLGPTDARTVAFPNGKDRRVPQAWLFQHGGSMSPQVVTTPPIGQYASSSSPSPSALLPPQGQGVSTVVNQALQATKKRGREENEDDPLPQNIFS